MPKKPPPIRRLAVNTGGGDAPGLNAVIRAVVLSALNQGWEVVGIRDGYNGLFKPQEYPDGGKWVLSSGGGMAPRWHNDGDELLYLAPDSTLMSVAVRTSDGFAADSPRPLFSLPAPGPERFAVSPDGERFLFNLPVDPDSAPTLVVVLE